MITCQKSITINVVGQIPSLYWKMDEAGSVTRVDSVHGATLPVVPFVAVPSTAGIIGNGANFLGPGSSELFNTAPSPFFPAYTGIGFTMSVWLRVNTFSASDEIVIGFGVYAIGGQTRIEFDYNPTIARHLRFNVFTATDPTQFIDLGAVPDATFLFLTAIYNAAAKTVRVAINRGPTTVVVLPNAFVPFVLSAVEIITGDGTANFTVDELGIWNNQLVTDTFLDGLYNGGAYHRPSGV